MYEPHLVSFVIGAIGGVGITLWGVLWVWILSDGKPTDLDESDPGKKSWG